MITDKVGRFQVQKKLGEGGMGAVYHAYDPKLGREVALKVLLPGMLEDDDARARFELEAKTIIQLEHKAIVPVYDVDEMTTADNTRHPFLVMRYMAGGTVAGLLKKGPLPIPELMQMISRIASALDFAHAQGIIHRDVKPNNILLDNQNEAFLADFGIVKLMQSAVPSITGNNPLGTLAYMSPEQIKAEDIDGRSDIYALGGLLFAMLTGQRPYPDRTGAQLVNAHLYEPPPRPCALNPTLPFTCDRIVETAMAKAPRDRYATAAEMVDALKYAFNWSSAQYAVPSLAAAVPDATGATLNYASAMAATDKSLSVGTAARPPSARQWWRYKRWWFSGAAGIIFLALLFGLFGKGPAAEQIPAAPMPTSTRDSLLTATLLPTASPTAVPSTPLPQRAILLSGGDSAIWEVKGITARLPDDGYLPLPLDASTVSLQTNSEGLTLLLPNRATLLLGAETKVEITAAADPADVRVALVTGLAALRVDGLKRHIFVEEVRVEVADGLLGLEFDRDTGVLEVDCLEGKCGMALAESAAIPLSQGEHRSRTAAGLIGLATAARYNRYSSLDVTFSLANSVPTPAEMASLTPEATSGLAFDFSQPGPETVSFGSSVQGRPLEVIRLGRGRRAILLIGGMHAGYAPNTVAAAESVIDTFTGEIDTIPAAVSLYIIPNLNPDSEPEPGEVVGRLNANNVDLNRNWECHWEPDANVLGTVIFGGGGREPASEPESQALKQLLEEIQPKAVIIWGATRAPVGSVAPGVCDEADAASSFPLADTYAAGARYEVDAGNEVTGDVSNWLAKMGTPAIFVLLQGFEAVDAAREAAGVREVITAVAAGSVNQTAAAESCTITAASRWVNLYNSRFKSRLGCPLSDLLAPTGAYQRFPGGLMLWRQDREEVYILYNNKSYESRSVNDPTLATYQTAPEHRGAFGFLWDTDAEIRRKLGDTDQIEHATQDFFIQDFSQGVIFTFTDAAEGTYTFFLMADRYEWSNP